MRWFRDLAISRKLAVTSAALVVSMGLALGTAFILFAAREYRTTTAARVAALAGVIESNSHAAVSFEDGRQAAETLAALSVEPDVDLACMFTSEGRLLAAFPPAAVARCHPRARGRESELTFDRGGVELVRPIVLQGETIGQLAIHRGFGDFRAYMVRQATVGAVVMALGILISLGLAVPLHRFFTEPIERLVATAAQVARGEYSVRATKLGNDELGVLTDAVNEMLSQIEHRGQALAGYRAHLEATVEERTAELLAANDELRVQKERAEESTRLKSQFLANMSHEIRTPLNGVLGVVELLLASGLSPRQRQLAATAQRSGQLLLSVINDILDFSKIEAGRIEFEMIPFDLRTTIEDAVELVAEEAHRKRIRLGWTMPCDAESAVRGDRARFSQILVNLLGNAVKFTNEGEVHVDVKTEDAGGDLVRVRAEVHDTGIGIAPEAVSRLFTAFQQADGSTTRRFGGSGLGLVIARQLSELMDGDVWVESEPGRGSTFGFTVLLARQPAAASATPPPAELSSLRVMLASEHDATRQRLQCSLETLGATCQVMPTLASALDELIDSAATRRIPDALVIDLSLSSDSAMSIARAIDTDPRLRELPRVYITQDGERPDPELGLAAGSSKRTWLRDPVRTAEIAVALTRSVPAAGAAVGPPVGVPPADRVRRGTVLLVEDNPTNRDIAAAMLDLLGCHTALAENGLEAIGAVRRQRFDLVLMDCQMPVLDGFEATRRIRDLERAAQRDPRTGSSPRLPIVALTAYAVAGDRQRCIEAGMDDYLAKPFTRTAMQSIIERWLPQAPPALPSAGSAGGSPRIPHPQRPPSKATDVLDLALVAQLRELDHPGDTGTFARAIDAYCRTAGQYLAAIQQSAERGDAQGVWRAAHSLKSSSGFVGATDLAARLHEIEREGRAGMLEKARELIEGLPAQISAVCRALEAEVRS